MTAMRLLMCVLLFGAQETPVLELEGLDGVVRSLAPAELPLADPRGKDAWVIRPRNPAGERGNPGQARVTFANGDELVGDVSGGAGESFRLELGANVAVACPIEAVRALVFPERIPPADQGRLAPAPEGDRLYRRGAALDVLDGTIESFEPEGVRFDGVLGKSTVAWADVAALFVAVLDEGAPVPASRGVPVQLDFVGAGRARAGLVALERAGARVVLGPGSELLLPYASLAEITVADGRLTYLSDLRPSGETGKGTPFDDGFGMQWPHRMDRSVTGGELLRAGERVRRGIGMHAPSRLTFALDGSYAALRGEVALDASTRLLPEHARGSVIFRLFADGALLWESPKLRGGDAPLSFGRLDLAGKRELVLELDPAGDFAGDRGNWLGIALVR